MVSTFVEDPPCLPRGIRRVDWLGIALLSIGLTGMQVVLERGQENNWFQSRWITMATIITILALTTLVFWELSTKEPIVNFRVLRNIPLSVGASMGLLFGVAFFGTTLVCRNLPSGCCVILPIRLAWCSCPVPLCSFSPCRWSVG